MVKFSKNWKKYNKFNWQKQMGLNIREMTNHPSTLPRLKYYIMRNRRDLKKNSNNLIIDNARCALIYTTINR